jgi:sialic acid synthase SpsE
MKIIAEAGCNWHTRREAIEFIKRSKELGLFATKFQIYNDDLIKDNPHREFLKSIMIDKNLAAMLFLYGHQIDQEVFFTPMFLEAIEWCEDIGVNYYKIRYADRNNATMLDKIASINKPTFLSCDIRYLNWKYVDETKQPYFMYCSPKYPSDLSDYRFSIKYGRDKNFQGISDHTSDLQLLKTCLEHDKYQYFEKHVKLNWNCIEEKWSVTFKELEEVLK